MIGIGLQAIVFRLYLKYVAMIVQSLRACRGQTP